MDLAIALGQGLGLAVAAGFFASAPLAIGASAASLGVADGALSFADDPLTVAVLWIAAAVELAADAIWPGAEAGARLVRRVIGGGLAFELVAGNEVPYVGLLIGAAVAAAVGISLRQIRTRAIKGGGDARGTALVEDGAGVATGVVGWCRSSASSWPPQPAGCSPARAAASRRSTRACGCCASPAPHRSGVTVCGTAGLQSVDAQEADPGRDRRPRAELLDRTIAAGRAPNLARLQQLGSRTDACVSTFPSLTPVCLSALITGSHPAGSGIPSLTWYHRGEGRFVEYGSPFWRRGGGHEQMVDDVLVNLNLLHMSPRATTVFEALEDAGLVTASLNTFVCRGRVRHPITREAARRIARRVGIVDASTAPSASSSASCSGRTTPARRATSAAPSIATAGSGPLAGHAGRLRLPVSVPVRDRRRAASRRGRSGRGGAGRQQPGTDGGRRRWLGRVPRTLRHRGRCRPLPDDRGARRGRHRAVRGPRAVPLQPPLRSRPV